MEQEAINRASNPVLKQGVDYPINNLGQTIDSAYSKLNAVLNMSKDNLIDLAIRSYQWYENTSTPQKFVEKFIYEINQC
tara:strand:- start:358 stop:594 length:237 start_codon:yes stop_codon:yes gene_type:complete